MNKIVVILIFTNVFLTSIVLAESPVEVYLGYPVIMILLPMWFLKFRLNKELIILFLILILGGIYGIMSGGNTFPAFIKIFINIFVNISFYYFLLKIEQGDVKKVFGWYMKGAVVVGCIGLVQLVAFQLNISPLYEYGYILDKWSVNRGGTFGIRVNSVFSEPAYYGATMAPAFFVAFNNLIRREKHYLSIKWSIVMVIIFPLTSSSVAYIGIFIALILLMINYGFVRLAFIVLPIIVFSHYYLIVNVEDYKSRFEGSVGLFQGDVTSSYDVHGSSFVQYNHSHVTWENLKKNPILGTGLGSHQFAYDKYSLVREFGGIWNFNRQDGNSMGLRILSETGIVGALIMIFFIVRFLVLRPKEASGSDYWLIANSCLVIILLQILRQGNYTYNGFFLFIMLYYFTWKKNQEAKLRLIENKRQNTDVQYDTSAANTELDAQ